MTYAEEAAHKAIDEARRCEFAAGGMHSEACRAAARAINAAIERCAQEVEEHAEDATHAAELIRALAASAALQPAPVAPCPGWPTWERAEYAIHCTGCSHPNSKTAAAPQLSVPAEPRHVWVNPTMADADGWCCTVKARGREEVTCGKKALVFCEQDHGDGTCLEGRCREHARGIATEPPCPACAILIRLPPNGMECSTHGDPREPPAAPPAGTAKL